MKQHRLESFLNAATAKRAILRPKHYAYFIIALGALLALIGGSGCRTFKQAAKTMDKQPVKRAEYCGSHYKPTEKTTIKIVQKPGKPVLVPGETVYVEYDCDSAVAAEKAKSLSSKLSPVKIRVPVPVYKQVDTAAIEMKVERDNVAALAAKDSVIAAKDRAYTIVSTKLTASQETCSTRLWWAIWGWLAFLLLAALIAWVWHMQSKKG